MDKRLQVVSARAKYIENFLEQLEDVSQVLYPTLRSHPTYDIYLKYVNEAGPGCIWFGIETVNYLSTSKVRETLKSLSSPILVYETSYGSSYCKVDPWPKVIKIVGETTNDDKYFIWIRLAIGYDKQIIKEDFEAAITNLVSTFKNLI